MWKLLVLLPFFAFAAWGEAAAVVKSVSGEARLIKNGVERAAQKGDKIEVKDKIKTLKNSNLSLIFSDNTVVTVGQNSEFSVDEYLFEPSEKKGRFGGNLQKGSLACVTGLIAKMNPESMKMQAKTATMGIRGTYFLIEVEE